MARAFDGTADYLSRTGAVVTGEPLTMACWFRTTDLTATRTMIGLGNNGASGFWRMYFSGTAGDTVVAQKQSDAAAGGAGAAATGSVADAGWHHGAVRFTNDTSREAALNGSFGSAETTNTADPSVDFTSVGSLLRSTAASFWQGDIAEVGIWNVALTNSEVVTLASGFSPLLVRPQALVSYWPLFGRAGAAGDEEDWAGGLTLTQTSSPALADHPNRIIYPSRPRIIFPAAAAATTVPVFMHHYKQMAA